MVIASHQDRLWAGGPSSAKSVDLRQLRYFLQIVERKSFGKAAAALRMAQPALSQQIRRLEDDLGVRLLVRHAAGVTPTSAGETLARHARLILDAANIARQETIDCAEVVTGRVSIGLPTPIALAFGTEIVRSLLARYPKVAFNLIQDRSVHLEQMLLEGALDLALCYNPTPTPLLLHEPIWREELLLFGAADHSELPDGLDRAARLADYPLILPARPNTIRTVVDSAAAYAGARLQIVLEIDSLTTIIDLAAEGFAYAILNEHSVGSELLRRRLRGCRLPQPSFAHELVLSCSVGRPLSRAARELARLIVNLLQKRRPLQLPASELAHRPARERAIEG